MRLWKPALRPTGRTLSIALQPQRKFDTELEICPSLEHAARMSKIQRIEAELKQLSPAELKQVREWLDDFVEDALEFTPEFESTIRESDREMASEVKLRMQKP